MEKGTDYACCARYGLILIVVSHGLTASVKLTIIALAAHTNSGLNLQFVNILSTVTIIWSVCIILFCLVGIGIICLDKTDYLRTVSR